MSSAQARRASYQLEMERRESVKATHPDALANKEGKDNHMTEPDQQQPSPLAARKALKRAAQDDDSDEDNNQEEAVTPVQVPFSLHRRLFSREDTLQEAEPVVALKAEKKPQQIHNLRKQAALNSDPPLTTARLRQENAALKLKISELGNQHEAQTQAIQTQLAQTLSAHEQVEQTLKNQISQLEKRQAEATSTVQKCQLQVESLLEKLREVENRSEKIDEPQPQSLCPPTPLKPSQRLLTSQRRGNGSPLPYGKHAKLGSVKPFAWRDSDDRVRTAHGMLASPSTMSPDTPLTNKYRMPSFSASPATPVTARYVPVVPRFPGCGSFEVQAKDLPVPFAHQQQPQQARAGRLEKKPSASLLSYCADVISSTFSPTAAPGPSPSMKVMPAWKVDKLLQNGFNTMSCPPPAHVDTPLPGDFTAINMPPLSFSGGESSPSTLDSNCTSL